MKRGLILLANLLVTMASVGLPAGTASAAGINIISYVSVAGVDTNDCASVTTACRSFDNALSKTAEGGTLQCLNAGDFGVVNIAWSVTIDCLAGGGTNNTRGVAIIAPGASVKLRNLSVQAYPPGNRDLIAIQAATSVSLENVFVARGRYGIFDSRPGPVKLYVANSTFDGNAAAGIVILPGGGVLEVALNNIRSIDNNYGLAIGAGGRVTIMRSEFSGNIKAGIEADPGTVVGIDGTLVASNGIGLWNFGTMTVADSAINSNTTAFSGASVRSFGNNRVFANSSDGTPLTPVGSVSSDNGLR